MYSPICVICDEKVTPSKVTQCPYCEFGPCLTCVRKYVLNETDTKCMNCKKPWTRAHQNKILKPTFVNDQLRTHQEQVLYEREMALFPATIEVIEDRRTLNRLNIDSRIIQEKLNAKHMNLRYLKTILRENGAISAMSKRNSKLYSDFNIDEIDSQIQEISKQYEIEMELLRDDQHRYQVIRSLIAMPTEERKVVMSNYIEGAIPEEILETLRSTGQLNDAIKRSRTQFIRACPIETCRGFLSQQWKCGICNVFTCPKCNIPKIKNTMDTDTVMSIPPLDASSSTTSSLTEQPEDDQHVCNPDDVATAELIAKDTKPCPQCGTGIFKIDGCDQMWCTECRTPFNWRTGQLETGHFHNPHYFEYQRRIGADTRNILDLPCNAMATNRYHGVIHHLIDIILNANSTNRVEREKRGLPQITSDMRIKLRERSGDYAMSIHYYADRVLPRYRPDAIQDNLELRVDYLTEQITETEFKTTLSREAKQFNKRIEIGQIVQTVVFGMSDILTRLVNFLRQTDDRTNNVNYCNINTIFAIFSEIDALIEYANECLDFICKQYKSTRVAIFLRNTSNKNFHVGLYTVRQTLEPREEGGEPEAILTPVKPV